jgi:hypothetical protein
MVPKYYHFSYFFRINCMHATLLLLKALELHYIHSKMFERKEGEGMTFVRNVFLNLFVTCGVTH